MSEANKDVKSSLKVMINKQKSKVLFAEADCYFAEILLSFLTLPLGRITKILEKHYGEETPTVGSLNSLFHGLANLDTSHFWSKGAKNTLLNPTSSFDNKYESVFRRLKLDITHSPPAESFYCTKCNLHTFRSESVFYDNVTYCHKCKLNNYSMSKKKAVSRASFACFTTPRASFVVFDDLHILPNDTAGLLRISSFLATSDMDEAEAIQVDLGFNEVMDLLRASLTSQTPLSDVILNKATRMRNSAIVASQSNISLTQPQIGNAENPNPKNLTLKVIVQKSTSKLLYAEATKEFVEFLFSFLYIPLGGVEHLVAGKTCIKALDNLYRSAIDLKDEYYSDFLYPKERLIQPNLAHGYMPKDHILPLTEECLTADHYSDLSIFYSATFPLGQGSYISGSGIYQVKDDLTVVPFSIASILPSLGEQKIPISDVKEMELQIGSKEALRILKASLTSTSALSDALLKNNMFKKRLKREV